MIDRNRCKQLPTGEHLVSTLTAAHEYKATPQAFTSAAKAAGLTRYATRTEKNQVGHLWLVDEVEALARKRFAATLVVETDDIVPAPYDGQA